MTRFTLTLLDATGIQDYIFSSNRLQENIGASEIVYRATTLWVVEALEKADISAHNARIGNDAALKLDASKQIENNPALQVEIIQAAGGNTILLFRQKEAARQFAKTLTLRILTDAPGLNVAVQHNDEFEFGQGKLSEAISALSEKLRAHKRSRQISTSLLGMAVTAICDSTGLPAINTLGGTWQGEKISLPGEDNNSLISAEAAAKRGWSRAANQRLQALLKDAADRYIFPYDLEKLGRFKGEESYIAVIHADGNRMGSRIRKLGENVKNDREYINKLREFSGKIENISRAALENVVALVVQAVRFDDIPVVENYLPFRPLVFGGDDVTFVCNGLIGVSLAAAYIEAFEREAANQEIKELQDFHASAGVSIVKLHYPFARAYKLAEELTASAKTLNRDPKPDCSAIDWHFAQSGLSGSLKVIREREYKVNSGHLEMRPLKMKGDHRSWETVKQVMRTFKKDWSDKHNKVVGLREALRNGSDAVRKYLQDYELEALPEIAGLPIQDSGWQGDRCYYFDAVELVDHYVSLENEKVEAKQ